MFCLAIGLCFLRKALKLSWHLALLVRIRLARHHGEVTGGWWSEAGAPVECVMHDASRCFGEIWWIWNPH